MRARRRDADRHARPVVQPGIENRCGGRVQPEGPGDVDRGAVQRRRVQLGRGDLRQAAVAFKLHVARPVDHDLADVRVCERRL